jgi:hypothetical protein
MKFARLRLVIAALLFIGWMGWLGYLALEHRKPVIVSRSQLLQAAAFLKCDIEIKADAKGEHTAVISNPVWLKNPPAGNFTIEKLDEAQLPGGKLLIDLPIGTSGTYLLLLDDPLGRQIYRLAPANGGPGSNSTARLIYPWSGEVERQLQ